MLFVDVTSGHTVQSPTAAGVLRAIAKWVADARVERKRKATLHSLLFASEHRLRDLGIRREELLEAIERNHGRMSDQ